MADLSCEFVGIPSPNPFWLASAPPTDKAYNVNRAFEAGWGGVVWKTLGEDPPIVNVNGPRYGAIHGDDRRVMGFNNIELITDRPLDVNLEDIAQVKREWPDRAMVVSLMVPMNEKSWADIVARVEGTGADGVAADDGADAAQRARAASPRRGASRDAASASSGCIPSRSRESRPCWRGATRWSSCRPGTASR